jgi:hypothetical protein
MVGGADGPEPQNGNVKVFLNILTVGGNAVAFRAIRAGIIGNVDCTQNGIGGYGIKDVITDADGKVYFYLPAEDEYREISLTPADSNITYRDTFPRPAGQVIRKTLYRPEKP